MNSIIMSDELSAVTSSLNKAGFNIISSEDIEKLPEFERRHADLQCLKIDDTYFVLKDCNTLKKKLNSLGLKVIETDNCIGSKYPENVLLNAVYINNKLYCKKSALDKSVERYCVENNIDIINVNQGYTKCSTALIGDSFITSDKGIFNTISQSGVEGLLINSGSIELKGVDYGFIGGCCFEYKDTVYFSGNIKLHPDYKRIKEFCNKKNKNIVSLSEDKLYDIGGFIVV